MSMEKDLVMTLMVSTDKLLTALMHLAHSLKDENREKVYRETGLRIQNGVNLRDLPEKERERKKLKQLMEDRDFYRFCFLQYLKEHGITRIGAHKLVVPKDGSWKEVVKEMLNKLKLWTQMVEMMDNENRRNTAIQLGKNAWEVTDHEASEHYCAKSSEGGADHEHNQTYATIIGLFEVLERYGWFAIFDIETLH